MSGFVPLRYWATHQMMKGSAERSCTFGFKCFIPLREFKLGNQVNPVNCKFRNLDSNFSCTLNVLKYALKQSKSISGAASQNYKVEREEATPFEPTSEASSSSAF